MAIALSGSLAAFGLARYETLHCRAHDLGNLTQAIASIWRGEPFRCTINRSLGLPLSYLGNHFSILLALLAPLVAATGDGRCLIVLQAVLIGACIPMAYGMAVRRFPPRTALMLAGLLAVHPALWLSGLFDVHQETMAMPLLLASLALAEADRWAPAALLTLTASLLTESIPLVAGFYWWVMAVRTGRRREGLALGAAHMLLFLTVMHWVIPFFAGTSEHPYLKWRYAHLGTDLTSIALSPLTRPRIVLAFLARPANLLTTLALVAPMGMIPLLGLELLLAPATALGIIAVDSTRVLDIAYNHVALALPYVFLATLVGLERAARRYPRLLSADGPAPRLATALVLNALAWHVVCHSAVMPGLYPPFSPLSDWGYYRAGPSRDAVMAMISGIPPDATLSAQQNLVAPLGARRDVYVFPDGADLASHILLDLTRPYVHVRELPRTTLLWGLWAPDGLTPWIEVVQRILDDPAWGVEATRGNVILLRRGASRAQMPHVRALVHQASIEWHTLDDFSPAEPGH